MHNVHSIVTVKTTRGAVDQATVIETTMVAPKMGMTETKRTTRLRALSGVEMVGVTKQHVV